MAWPALIVSAPFERREKPKVVADSHDGEARTFMLSPARWIAAVPALALLFIRALSVRHDTHRRRRSGDAARLIYGPVPIISIKYMSRAMRSRGYKADTLVYVWYSINQRDDFDYTVDDFFEGFNLPAMLKFALKKLIGPYVCSFWLLPRYDVYNFFFDGGFLAGTPLRFLEVQLLHLAGKKVVVMPYGSDAAATTHMQSLAWRQGLMASYGGVGRAQAKVLKSLAYFSLRADYIVACIIHAETLPRWDLLTTHYYPIDTTEWCPETKSVAPPRAAPKVTVAHAPNHRGVKGTEFLIAACRELQQEGLNIELQLLEGLPNSEVRRVLRESDILAEQFILGYGLNGMEGMSLAKPVLSNLNDDHFYAVHRLYTGLDECPILSTSVDQIKDHIRLLALDPDLRIRLGEEGRRYVEKYHSYRSVGVMWDHVYRHIWNGEKVDLQVWHPDKFETTSRSHGATTGW